MHSLGLIIINIIVSIYIHLVESYTLHTHRIDDEESSAREMAIEKPVFCMQYDSTLLLLYNEHDEHEQTKWTDWKKK